MLQRTVVPGLTLLLLGCGGAPSDQPDLGTVSGVVTFDSEPLADAEVIFQPDSGRPSFATTNQKGEYDLEFSRSAKGAKVGRHVVAVRAYREVEDDEGNRSITPETVPNVYNDASELVFEVKPGSNVYDIPIDSSRGKVVQPRN